MNDRLLEKFKDKVAMATANDATRQEEVETIDDFGAFGWLRGIRDRAIMLELRKKNGNIRAIGYSWVEQVEFDPSVGITLLVGGQKLRIKGRNLNSESRPLVRLFQGITRHRVPWIQEVDEPAAVQADKAATVIEAIEW